MNLPSAWQSLTQFALPSSKSGSGYTPVCRVCHFSTRSPVCKGKTSSVPVCTDQFWSDAVKIWAAHLLFNLALIQPISCRESILMSAYYLVLKFVKQFCRTTPCHAHLVRTTQIYLMCTCHALQPGVCLLGIFLLIYSNILIVLLNSVEKYL